MCDLSILESLQFFSFFYINAAKFAIQNILWAYFSRKMEFDFFRLVMYSAHFGLWSGVITLKRTKGKSSIWKVIAMLWKCIQICVDNAEWKLYFPITFNFGKQLSRTFQPLTYWCSLSRKVLPNMRRSLCFFCARHIEKVLNLFSYYK